MDDIQTNVTDVRAVVPVEGDEDTCLNLKKCLKLSVPIDVARKCHGCNAYIIASWKSHTPRATVSFLGQPQRRE